MAAALWLYHGEQEPHRCGGADGTAESLEFFASMHQAVLEALVCEPNVAINSPAGAACRPENFGWLYLSSLFRGGHCQRSHLGRVVRSVQAPWNYISQTAASCCIVAAYSRVRTQYDFWLTGPNEVQHRDDAQGNKHKCLYRIEGDDDSVHRR